MFPERRAYTVAYELSPAERELYDLVTEYVRTEMGRAECISQAGDRKRGNNVGFALTVLQRRLASSPEAILRSLERRRRRLEDRLRELTRIQEMANPAEEEFTFQCIFCKAVRRWSMCRYAYRVVYDDSISCLDRIVLET